VARRGGWGQNQVPGTRVPQRDPGAETRWKFGAKHPEPDVCLSFYRYRTSLFSIYTFCLCQHSSLFFPAHFSSDLRKSHDWLWQVALAAISPVATPMVSLLVAFGVDVMRARCCAACSLFDCGQLTPQRTNLTTVWIRGACADSWNSVLCLYIRLTRTRATRPADSSARGYWRTPQHLYGWICHEIFRCLCDSGITYMTGWVNRPTHVLRRGRSYCDSSRRWLRPTTHESVLAVMARSRPMKPS